MSLSRVTLMSQVGVSLKSVMEASGASPETLASFADCDVHVIDMVLSGRHHVAFGFAELEAIADALQFDVSVFFRPDGGASGGN